MLKHHKLILKAHKALKKGSKGGLIVVMNENPSDSPLKKGVQIVMTSSWIDAVLHTQADKKWLARKNVMKALLFIELGSFCMMFQGGKWCIDTDTLDTQFN